MEDGKRKIKRRYSEKRRQAAKEAAQIRRRIEAEIYQSMVSHLPLDLNISGSHNYSQALKISVAFLQLHQFSSQSNRCSVVKVEDSHAPKILEALHGFFVILSANGNVIFVSENIIQHLGLSQAVVLGCSIYEFLHHCDIKQVRSILTQRCNTRSDRVHFLCRIKCTLTDKGALVNIKSAPHRVFEFIGRRVSSDSGVYLMALCQPILHPASIEIALDSHTFLSRHDPDMVFTHCDDQMKKLVGFTRKDVIGRSAYEYHHACDHDILVSAYTDLFSKGQSVSEAYRFLVKHGGYVPMISQSTILYHTVSRQPRSIVSVYFVLGGVQCRDVIFSHVQVPKARTLTNRLTHNNSAANETKEDQQSNAKSELPVLLTSPVNKNLPTIRNSKTEISTEKKLRLRAPSLPKGGDVQIWSKLPKYAIFGALKMPVGSTESVLMSTKSVLTPIPAAASRDSDSDVEATHTPLSAPCDDDLPPLESQSPPSLGGLDLSNDSPHSRLGKVSTTHGSTGRSNTHQLSPHVSSPNRSTSHFDLSPDHDLPPDREPRSHDTEQSCDKQYAPNEKPTHSRQTDASILKHLLLFGTKPTPPLSPGSDGTNSVRTHGQKVSPLGHVTTTHRQGPVHRNQKVYEELSSTDYDTYAPADQTSLLYGREIWEALES
uniref:Hypoxia-inducible factor 1 n=1 Tax=Meiomenia swedmarki TaxID=1500384 RepID=A0AA96HC10_9MOLL|nr:hypoxia-inducible factor 1 [Meiomenia swedmarki]